MQANTRAESSDLILPARTLMLTTTCTGGCVHCPFSHPALKQVSMRRDVFRKILADSKGEYLVLSGGEPLNTLGFPNFLPTSCLTLRRFGLPRAVLSILSLGAMSLLHSFIKTVVFRESHWARTHSLQDAPSRDMQKNGLKTSRCSIACKFPTRLPSPWAQISH